MVSGVVRFGQVGKDRRDEEAGATARQDTQLSKCSGLYLDGGLGLLIF